MNAFCSKNEMWATKSILCMYFRRKDSKVELYPSKSFFGVKLKLCEIFYIMSVTFDFGQDVLCLSCLSNKTILTQNKFAVSDL